MKLNKNPKGSGLSLSLITNLIIAGIVLLIILLLSNTLFQTSNNATNNSQCLGILSQLDKLSSNGDNSRIKALFDKSCSPVNKTILNREQFIDELNNCNSKAQIITKQENFLLKNSNLCFPCSLLKSEKNLMINTNELGDDFSNINSNELYLNIENEQELLVFIVKDEKITFGINSNDASMSCNNFLNS